MPDPCTRTGRPESMSVSTPGPWDPSRIYRHTRAVFAAFVLMMAAGIVALEEIPKEAEPDVNLPLFRVSVTASGISPQDIDRLVITPLTRELRNLEGLKELRSIARLGGANLSLEFDEDFDRERAHALLRERLEVVRAKLPASVSQPRIHEVNLGSFPLIVVTVAGAAPVSELMGYARALRETIAALPGVLDATLIGERDEVIDIVTDPLLLESHGLDASALPGIVNAANRAISGGRTDGDGARLTLTMPGLVTDVTGVAALPVKAANGSVITLGDLGLVRRTLTEPTSVARVNGTPALAISVTKRVGENVLETLDTLRATVKTATKKWPRVVQVGYTQDRSWRIRTRISELRNSLISAVIIVMTIVIAALGFRSGMLVGLAIPGAFLLAILALVGLGVSINTAVLYAFVMSVGLLVDGAIVIVESADRLMQEGLSRFDAYVRSARTLGIPVLSSTATTLAAFVPLLFWPGVIGEYMKFLPLTIFLTLAASLIMALLFVPVLGALGAQRPASVTTAENGSRSGPAARSLVLRAYLRALTGTLRYPAWAVAASIVLLVGSVWSYERYGQGVEFLPEMEPANAVVHIRARGELSLPQQVALATQVERLALRDPAFETVMLTVGEHANRQTTADDVIASMALEFRPWHEHRPAQEVLDELREKASEIPGIAVEVRANRPGPFAGKPIQLDITGHDYVHVDETVQLTREKLANLPGVRDIEDSRPRAGLEWRVHIDREEAARYGVNLASAAQYAQLVTRGLKLGVIRSPASDKDIDIRVRFPSRYRSVEGLAALRVSTTDGAVPLEQFATLVPQARTGTIERIDGLLARRVVADIEPDLPKEYRLGDLMAQIEGWALGTALPEGTRVNVRGEDEDRQRTRDFLWRAFAGALFLIGLILLIQFNSFYYTFLVLFAVGIATVGVQIGLLIIDQPFSVVMSGIGVIALAGIVVNNNIILIATYRERRRAGLDAHAALLAAGRMRLRPVLLTTVTTIAGLLPLVLRIEVDYAERSVAIGAPSAEYWVQMSAAVVFGLAFASVLTLFITPAAIMLRARVDRARARARERERDTGQAETIGGIFAAHGPAVGFAATTAIISAWVFIPELIVVRITDIFSKQIFEQPPSRWFQALEWASFWSLIVLGAGYAYWKNAHVRVDIVRERLSSRGKAFVEIIGFFLLLGPVCAVVLIAGWDFVLRSYLDEEASGALLGSPTQWIFKGAMLLCYFQLLWLGGYVTWRNIRFLRGKETHSFPPEAQRAVVEPTLQTDMSSDTAHPTGVATSGTAGVTGSETHSSDSDASNARPGATSLTIQVTPQ
ncbi:MAG: multidrug efflux pump [Gammaproteobacteria bacterium]|jgi:multidrug efflux pump